MTGAASAGRRGLLKEDPYQACALLSEALSSDPDNGALISALMAAKRRDAAYHEAIGLADRLLARDPDNIEALYEKAVSLARLGEGEKALAAFDRVVALNPEHAASWFGSHGPALERNGLDDALRRLRRAATRERANGRYWGFAHALLLLAGRSEEAEALYRERLAGRPNRLVVSDGAAALSSRLAADFRLFGVAASLLRFSLDKARQEGMVLEFGVRRGASLCVLAAAAGQEVFGFDSFEGLPEGWVGAPKGRLTTGLALPELPANARLCPGWFEESLPAFLAQRPGPVRFVNIDSDLYSSARTALFGLKDRLGPGAILVFDEMIGNRSWREDEYRAFMEFIELTGFGYEFIAASPFTKQAAVRLLRAEARPC